MYARRRLLILTALATAPLAGLAACGRLGYDGERDLDGGGYFDDGGWSHFDDGGWGWHYDDGGYGFGGCDQPFSAPQRVASLSIAGVDDWAPYLSSDGLSIYFASWRSGASDLYVATRASVSDDFGTPVLLADVSSSAYETSPSLTPAGDAIYFIGPSATDLAVFDVFAATGSAGGAFATPLRDDVLSSPQHDTSIEISRDGLSAFVVSNRSGGAGGRDIWRAVRRRTIDAFGAPQPVVELNSAGDEGSTTLSADGNEIIFSANRPGGAGGLDLWHAHRSYFGNRFDAPTRLAELASSHDDSRPSLSADGKTLYFNYAANEDGGDDADIWVATRCSP
jgi:hypothetical protein